MGATRIVRKNLIRLGVVRKVRQEGRWKYIDLRKPQFIPKLPSAASAGTVIAKSVPVTPSAWIGRLADRFIAMIHTYVGLLKGTRNESRPI